MEDGRWWKVEAMNGIDKINELHGRRKARRTKGKVCKRKWTCWERQHKYWVFPRTANGGGGALVDDLAVVEILRLHL